MEVKSLKHLKNVKKQLKRIKMFRSKFVLKTVNCNAVAYFSWGNSNKKKEGAQNITFWNRYLLIWQHTEFFDIFRHLIVSIWTTVFYRWSNFNFLIALVGQIRMFKPRGANCQNAHWGGICCFWTFFYSKNSENLVTPLWPFDLDQKLAKLFLPWPIQLLCTPSFWWLRLNVPVSVA